MKKFLALIGIIIVVIVILAIIGKKKGVDPMTSPEEVNDVDNMEEMDMGDTTTGTPSETSGTTAGVDVGVSINTSANAKTFNVTGKNFEYSTKEMKVKKGDTVTVKFTSTGGFHDFVVDGIAGAATARVSDGQSASVTFVADKAGTYEFYCSVGNHRQMGMVGKFIVEA